MRFNVCENRAGSMRVCGKPVGGGATLVCCNLLWKVQTKKKIVQSPAAKRSCGYPGSFTHVLALWALAFIYRLQVQALVSSDKTDTLRCSHVVQRRNRVTGRGDAAILARCSDRCLAVCVLRVPVAVRDQGVGTGQWAACITNQTGEMGRWEHIC